MSLIVWFDRYRPHHRARIGGKNAGLGEMISAGLPVPPGFALTTDAYDTLRKHAEARRRVNEALSGVDHGDPVGLQGISAEVRRIMEAIPLDPQVGEQVATAYSELSERCGRRDVPVAVRSSATAEDLPDASFAGQQDTFLWVRGIENVLGAVRRCWSSIFTDRAISYRHNTGHSHEVIAMSVGIQQMVESLTAGVAFTLNPTDGDRSQIVIDASWGFGEAVVGGEVTPDNFKVDKVLLEIMNRDRVRPGGRGIGGSPDRWGPSSQPGLPHRPGGQGDSHHGPPGREALRNGPGHRVGHRSPPAGARQRCVAAGAPRDGLEPKEAEETSRP